ncbi:MAG: hypothetical protein AABZ31_11550 [Bdellovibrionota bacterium]
MTKPISLAYYRNKKRASFELETFRKMHAEYMERCSSDYIRPSPVDKKIIIIDKSFDEMSDKFEALREEMHSHVHQIKILLEEQNLRNRQDYPGLFA